MKRADEFVAWIAGWLEDLAFKVFMRMVDAEAARAGLDLYEKGYVLRQSSRHLRKTDKYPPRKLVMKWCHEARGVGLDW